MHRILISYDIVSAALSFSYKCLIDSNHWVIFRIFGFEIRKFHRRYICSQGHWMVETHGAIRILIFSQIQLLKQSRKSASFDKARIQGGCIVVVCSNGCICSHLQYDEMYTLVDGTRGTLHQPVSSLLPDKKSSLAITVESMKNLLIRTVGSAVSQDQRCRFHGLPFSGQYRIRNKTGPFFR